MARPGRASASVGQVINAEGELQAAEKLAQAAHIIGKSRRDSTPLSADCQRDPSETIPPRSFRSDRPVRGFHGAARAGAGRDSGSRALPERTAGERFPRSASKGEAKV